MTYMTIQLVVSILPMRHVSFKLNGKFSLKFHGLFVVRMSVDTAPTTGILLLASLGPVMRERNIGDSFKLM